MQLEVVVVDHLVVLAVVVELEAMVRMIVVLAQVLAQQIRAVVAVELFQMQRLEPEEKVWLS